MERTHTRGWIGETDLHACARGLHTVYVDLYTSMYGPLLQMCMVATGRADMS